MHATQAVNFPGKQLFNNSMGMSILSPGAKEMNMSQMSGGVFAGQHTIMN
jgi:hypothetical protein